MRFYDREKEIGRLREIEQRSQDVSQFTVISGRRRIGKTSLVKEAYKNVPMLYFFVARKAESELCQTFLDEVREKLDVPLIEGRVNSFAALFEWLMQLSKQRHLTLFIDEFQDFMRVNPSLFSEMQNIWDKYKDETHINLLVAGSVNTLLHKIFRDAKEPLFGRQTEMMQITPFPPSVLRQIISENAPRYTSEDLLTLYMLTGGVAKYVELFVDKGCLRSADMLRLILQEDSYFLYEGKNVLIEEFGKEYGTYFSVLSLIAQGRNTRSEMEDYLGGMELAGYLKKLSDDYGLIQKQQPLFEKSPNKGVRYALKDQFLRFWFRFIFKYQHIIEAGGMDRLLQIVERDYPVFSGHCLENYFRDCLRESGQYTRIGFWHDRKGENEIDIVAEDELSLRLEIVEVKRQAKNIDLALLRKKAEVFCDKFPQYKEYHVEVKGLSLDNM